MDAIQALVELALSEDLNSGADHVAADLTTSRIVPENARVAAAIIARQKGVVAGLDLARAVFHRLDPDLVFEAHVKEGDVVDDGTLIARLQGMARVLLVGERTALNFLQHLSGVATLTRSYAEAASGTKARITDTRKTTPGLRQCEKHAVVLGGGVNHRFGLYDAVLIKENHAATVDGVAEAVRLARQEGREHVPVYVEVRDLDEVRAVLATSPDRIMLDNMDPQTMRRAVDLIRAADADIDIEATGEATMEDLGPLVSGQKGRQVLEQAEIDKGLLYAGMVVGLINDVPSCKELVERIVADAEAIINQRMAAAVA